ncbi:MAG: aminotransferase class V-fold PLP-dependent enzyme, partial [Planctomycetaceae bacterium]|nr:aminotransferase class V-fold PLP-dependent enzyme [Planctomycetaceae bacterium]
ARSGGALFLVDAAQTAGHLPLNMAALPVDLVACPGHKGLLGPLGTGLLCLRAGIEERLQPVRQGGTGSHSEDIQQPRSLPDRYESGNHNAPGLFGLEAALEWLSGQGVKQVAAREQELTARLLDGLSSLRNIRIAGPADAEQQVAVVSISAIGFEPQELASILDESFEIETRAGLHCAPGAHRAAGTFDKGGTVRLSCGPFTTEQQIEAVIAALADITD